METKDREILSFLREMIKKAIEEMMKEERVGYLEEHPETKGNRYYLMGFGYYLMDLMTGAVRKVGLRVQKSTISRMAEVWVEEPIFN
jgi:hypothetical protein